MYLYSYLIITIIEKLVYFLKEKDKEMEQNRNQKI